MMTNETLLNELATTSKGFNGAVFSKMLKSKDDLLQVQFVEGETIYTHMQRIPDGEVKRTIITHAKAVKLLDAAGYGK